MKDDKIFLSALDYLEPSQLEYSDWINVGMILKTEGYDVSVWDEWSKREPGKYNPGECEQKWRTFRGDDLKGGTLIQMAEERGWRCTQHKMLNKALDWDAEIEYDGEGGIEEAHKWQPVKELETYLRTLFKDDDIVGYVVKSEKTEKGKYVPACKGVYNRTAGELIKSLQKYQEDISWTIGDLAVLENGVSQKDESGGAWIRYNPLDGQGVNNDNVTDYRYALVESDTLSIAEQEAIIRRCELPVAALVHSGGKSLHAIIRVDAANKDEYRQRVAVLFDFLSAQGFTVDTQNKNPSRLSRMPGVTRNGVQQRLIATNIGRKSWVDWLDFLDDTTDELPDMEDLKALEADPPALPDELIEGILRQGHKMIIAGASKAGKSFMLMELSICIANGLAWYGHKCKRGKVLYVNLEIDKPSAVNRFINIRKAMNAKQEGNIVMWNLRGRASTLDKLVPKIVRRTKSMNLSAIIIDPIYKVITGDENNASEMGAFCNQFDKLCTETGCSVIYCHHHSKGSQGQKRSIDRASGSGVFARDPDAIIDMIELSLTSEVKNTAQENGATAWRLEYTLREFRSPKPDNLWFDYPVHYLDTTGELEKLAAEGSVEGNLGKSSKRSRSPERRRELLENAYDAAAFMNEGRPVRVKDIAEYITTDDDPVTERTIRNWIAEFPDNFDRDKGVVFRVFKKTET